VFANFQLSLDTLCGLPIFFICKYVDQLDQSCGKLSGIKRSPVTKERFTCNKRGKANWIGHIWRRICFLKHVIGGKTGRKLKKVKRGRRRRRKQLPYAVKETRGYWNLKEEEVDRST